MKLSLSFRCTFVLILLAPLALPAWNASAYTGCGGITVDPQNAAFEAQVVALANARRADAGLPPLKRIDGLDRAARYHAADMVQDDYFNHDSYDRQGGQLVQVCNTWDRIIPYYSSYSRGMAENIALGYGSPDAVVQGWMDSPGHRANLLNPSYWEIGVGYWLGDGEWDHYWVQDFGRRSDVYPLVINAEADSTTGKTVRLYIYGTTAEWQELRLRNENGEWSPWQAFTNELTWELASGSGPRTVSVELRGPAGSTTSQDSIQLFSDGDRKLPEAKYRLFLPLSKR
jgi:uncharacterized protein YkwD